MTYWPFDRGKIRESCQHVELMSSTISSYRRGGVDYLIIQIMDYNLHRATVISLMDKFKSFKIITIQVADIRKRSLNFFGTDTPTHQDC